MKLLPTLIALPFLALPALAGGLDRTQVDAQAKWVAHLDVERFRGSQFFQELKAADKNGEIEQGLARVASEQGIQLLDDVYSVTAYGTAVGPEHGIVLLQANAHVEAALTLWQQKAGAKAVRIGERDCLQWGAGDNGGYSCLLPAAEGSERRTIVLSKSLGEIGLALDVLAKKRPGLDTAAQSELYTEPAAGTFAYVAASGILDELAGPAGRGVQPVSAAARLTKGVRIEVGESAGSLFVDLRLRTERPEDAQKVQRILDGLLAMPGLLQGDSETAEVLDRLTQAVHVEALAEVAHVRFQYGAQALFAELQKLQALGADEQERLPFKAFQKRTRREENK